MSPHDKARKRAVADARCALRKLGLLSRLARFSREDDAEEIRDLLEDINAALKVTQDDAE